MGPGSRTCVVHLVRKKNGLAPFAAFIRSYRQHHAGLDHELLLIFKGFAGETDARDHYALVSDLTYRSLFVDDTGYDIGPYFAAARALDFNRFCFLNSYSEILADRWLAQLHEHVQREGVGIVGATGSYECMNLRPRPTWAALRKALLHFSDNVRLALDSRGAAFPPFPNYHVRTNAFIISRELMLRVKLGPLQSKMDLYLFESGYESMTRQIMAMRLRPLVVGRNGQGFEKELWRESRTFRIGEQENLLVADNQTRSYSLADSHTKTRLTKMTWGTNGDRMQ